MGIGKRSKEKERDHPPVLQRHNSYSYPGTSYYHDHDFWHPHPVMHSGMPPDSQHHWAPWYDYQTQGRRYPGFPNPQRPPSLRSTSATASDNQESAPSPVTNGFSSRTSSSQYSGHNSPVYSANIPDMMAQHAQIHGLLDAVSAPLVWDVRTQPKLLNTTETMPKHFYGSNTLSFPLTSSGAGHVRILSTNFPWVIIVGPKPRAITAGEALQSLYELLDNRLDATVWTLVDEQKKERIKRAKKKRSDCDDFLKNVDWLEKSYMFRGFYRDESIIQQILPPGSDNIPETWLVTFRTP